MREVLGEKTHRPAILRPAELFFKSERERKTFSDPHKLRKSVASGPASRKTLKEVFLERRKIVQGRNSDPRKVTKSADGGWRRSTTFMFRILDLTDNTVQNSNSDNAVDCLC